MPGLTLASNTHTPTHPHGGLLFPLLLIASLSAHAQTPPQSSPPEPPPEPEREERSLVITATRIPQPKSSVSTPLQTILKQEIERSGARNAAELLSSHSLVDIRNYGGLGGLKLPNLRGLSAEQTLVLLDGRRINPPQGGGVDLSDLDLEGVRRVEVLRGPASALYGSDAMGGVIQLITDVPEGPAQSSLRKETGSFGYHALRFSRSEQVGNIGYIVSARRMTYQGDYPYFNPLRRQMLNRLNDDLDTNAIRASLLPWMNAKGRLRVNFDWSQSERGAPGPVESPSTARQHDRLSALDVSYRFQTGESPASDTRHPTPDTQYELRGYVQGQRRLYDASKDVPLPVRTLQKVHTTGFEATARRESRHLLLTWGTELRGEGLTATHIDPKHRTVLGAYALGQLHLRKWTLLPALRWDQITAAGSQASPQLGALTKLSPEWTLRANVGRAFRAPSFDDLYWPEDSFSLGNAGLKPECATTADLGLGYSHARFTADVTNFDTRVRNLIVWTQGVVKPGKWSPVNVGQARIRGWELTGGYHLGDWGLRMGGSILDAKDRTSGSATQGKQLTYRPSGQLHLNLDWQKGRWGGGTDLLYDGQRYSTPDNTSKLGGYALINLRLRRALGGWEATLNFDNVLNRRYQVLAGYPLPGREAQLSLQQRF